MNGVGGILLALVFIPLLFIFGGSPGSAHFSGPALVVDVGWIGLAQYALAELMALVAAWRWFRTIGFSAGALILPGLLVGFTTFSAAGAFMFRVEVGPEVLKVRSLDGSLTVPWSGVKSAAVTVRQSGDKKPRVTYWLQIERVDGASASVGLSWLSAAERELLSAGLERFRVKSPARSRQRGAQREPGRERQRKPEEARHQRGAPPRAQRRQVDLHPRDHQQEQDPEPRHGREHLALRGARREQRAVEVRRKPAQHRRPQQHARQQLADDRGLAPRAERLAQHPRGHEQHEELRQQEGVRVRGGDGPLSVS